jgi:hypothetical protein
MIQAVLASSAGPGGFVHGDETKLSIGADGSSRGIGQAREGSFGRRKRPTTWLTSALKGSIPGFDSRSRVMLGCGVNDLRWEGPLEGVGIKRSD